MPGLEQIQALGSRYRRRRLKVGCGGLGSALKRRLSAPSASPALDVVILGQLALAELALGNAFKTRPLEIVELDALFWDRAPVRSSGRLLGMV